MKKTRNIIVISLLAGLCFAILVALAVVYVHLHDSKENERSLSAEREKCIEIVTLLRDGSAELGDRAWNYVLTRDTASLAAFRREADQVRRCERASQLLKSVEGHFLYKKQLEESFLAAEELKALEIEAVALQDKNAAVRILSGEEFRDGDRRVREGIAQFNANVIDEQTAALKEISAGIDKYLKALIAISVLFAALYIVLALIIARNRRNSRLDNAVITGLTEQYDCVMYVNNMGDSRADASKLFRNDDSLTGAIPGWNGNISFKRRLQLMADHLVHPDDKAKFLEQTRSGLVFGKLEEGEEYDVAFRVKVLDDIHYYRMIFVADREYDSDSAGKILGICVGIINTDAIVKMEEERRSAVETAQKLEEAGKLKSMFVQNISHDIRTPLNAIVGYSQLLAMPDMYLSDEEKAEFGEYVNTNAEILTMLVDDVLEMGDIESGNVKIEAVDVDCESICKKSIQSSRFRAQPGVKMHYTSDAPEGYTVHTDPRRVQQILTNFLSNACKHTEQGEIRLDCSTKENPGYVTFSVTDTGCGVPEDMADDIFNRFASLDRLVGGHGLGLNICLDLSKRLGGRVSLDKKYKNGARFVLEIPA